VNRDEKPKPKQFFYLSSALLLALSISLVYASVFVYYPASVNIQSVAPTLIFSHPPYSYTCTALVRTSRNAITYTDFETYPVSGWTNYGGANFQLVSGHKRYALRFSDNNGGVGRVSSQYYYNTRLDSYSSLWVSVKVYGSPTDTYKGLALLSQGRGRLYEVSIYGNSVYIRSYNVEIRNNWYQLNSTTISDFNSGYWYTIVLNYVATTTVAGTTVDFYVWVYDPNGNQVAYLTARSAVGRSFTPAYIGLEVDGSYGMFDDFVISRMNPIYVVFTGFTNREVLEIYDGLSYLPYWIFRINSSPYYHSVVRDIVVGVGNYTGIAVFYEDAKLTCLEWEIYGDAVVGGDSYSLRTNPITWSISSSGTSANVSAYIFSTANRTWFYAITLTASQSYYIRVQLNTSASTIDSSLNARIYIWDKGNLRSPDIVITNGVANPSSTDWVYLSAGSTVYIVVSRAYASAGSTSTLVFNVVACTNSRFEDPAPGACVFYPLTITLMAG